MLHCWIKFFECLLHIAYQLDFKKMCVLVEKITSIMYVVLTPNLWNFISTTILSIFGLLIYGDEALCSLAFTRYHAKYICNNFLIHFWLLWSTFLCTWKIWISWNARPLMLPSIYRWLVYYWLQLQESFISSDVPGLSPPTKLVTLSSSALLILIAWVFDLKNKWSYMCLQ